MPFTPFHFGPHACLSLPLYRRVDIPLFLGANVVIDIEPLLVMTFNLDYPLHGYCHTLLFGTLVGLALAAAAYPFRRLIGEAMKLLRVPYVPTFATMAISAVVGAWCHVLLDGTLHADIRPFYPVQANPLRGLLSPGAVHAVCVISFVPALAMYLSIAFGSRRKT